MAWGLVSNCFKSQLEAGESLCDLIERAVGLGYRVMELRQGCLGEYESRGELVPDSLRLAELSSRCPGVEWDLALGYSCFDPTTTGLDAVFEAGCRSIQSLAAGQTPHLRLVDLTTDHTRCDPSESAATVVRLLERVVAVGGVLSIEHSRESWAWFAEVFARAGDLAQADRGSLKMCFDPCNLLSAGDRPDPARVTEGLDPDRVSMIHIKQRRDGRAWPAVAAGEIDWADVIAAMGRMGGGRGYAGPWLLEVAPSRDIWEFLEGSRVYLGRLGLGAKRDGGEDACE